MSRSGVRSIVVCVCAVVLAGIALGYLVGCETVKGAGRDVTNVGEAGERAINGDSRK